MLHTTTTIATGPTAVAERFLAALSQLDIEAMFAELTDDVVCDFPTAPGGPQQVTGAAANRAFFTAIRPMWTAFTLTRVVVHRLAEHPDRVVAEFASNATLTDGSPYRNSYLALGTVRTGKISYWQEFSDPAPLTRGITALQATGPHLTPGPAKPHPAGRA
jgi:ketosteroid isomerase-like protein